jgi:hypothetical protein
MHIRTQPSWIPEGSKIKVGRPAEKPEEAIEALLTLFENKDTVLSARLGLMEIQYPDGATEFTYTIGIECSGDERTIIEEAVNIVSNVPAGRWPISIVPPTTPYFSNEAIVFYTQTKNRKTLTRMLRKVGIRFD